VAGSDGGIAGDSRPLGSRRAEDRSTRDELLSLHGRGPRAMQHHHRSARLGRTRPLFVAGQGFWHPARDPVQIHTLKVRPQAGRERRGLRTDSGRPGVFGLERRVRRRSARPCARNATAPAMKTATNLRKLRMHPEPLTDKQPQHEDHSVDDLRHPAGLHVQESSCGAGPGGSLITGSAPAGMSVRLSRGDLGADERLQRATVGSGDTAAAHGRSARWRLGSASD
jgi:hypothetical protein